MRVPRQKGSKNPVNNLIRLKCRAIAQNDHRDVFGWYSIEKRFRIDRPTAVIHDAITMLVLIDPPPKSIALTGVTRRDGLIVHRVDRNVRKNRALSGHVIFEIEHCELE